MDTNFEQIGPWNGAQDTGKDVRLKWQRNFDRIKANFEELTDLFEKVNLGTDEAPAWAIRAKYGLYTDEWMSAKGKNPSAGSTPMAGATELSKLTDVLLTSPADGQVLTYDTALGKWVNRDPEAAAGLDVEELAENLTTNRYATQDWVTQQGYATQTWASGQFALRTVAINAGTGLTGGGNLTASRTLSLATVGTAGTYTKVTTDRYGRVTDGATLQAGDIPTLSISKISGLQSALDGKLDADDFTELFEKVYVSGYGYAIRAKLALYTEGWLSAKGMNSDAGSTVVAGASSWDEIEGKPSTFPPSAHTHTVAQISDFPKQWAWADVSGKPAPLVNDTYYYGHNETSDFNDAVLGGAYLTRSESWPDNGPSSNYRYGVLAVFYSGISNARIGQLWMSHNGTGGIYARVKFDNNDGSWSFWRRLMDDDCIGSYNAGSATKLQTKRTISLTGAITGSIAFDGSQDVSINTTYSTDNIAALDGRYVNASGDTMTGSLTTPGIQLKGNLFIQGPSTPQGVYFAINSSGDMTFAGHSNATWTKTYGKIAYSTGNVGIGTDNPSYKLHVEGDIYTSTCVRIGGGSISWDADTGAFHFSHGVYTDGFISAKGANDDAGGTVAGGGSGEVHLKDIVDMADEWKLITSVSEIPATMSRWPSWSEVTGKPSTFAPSAHTHDWDDISGKPSTFAPSSHTHTWAQVTGKPSWITTNDGSGSGIDADLLDGTHKSGLFTAMSYSSNKLSITVGGTTKSVTIQAGSSGSYLPLSGGTLTGTLISNGSIQLKNNLFIQGSSTPQGVYFVINSSGDMTFAGHSNATWTKTYGKIAYSTGNVGIGTTSPSYKLHIAGSAYATNGFQNGSDVRYKHILADLTLTPAQVAAAPAFLFRWKDGTDRALHAGTSAQYWRDVLPQVVMEGGDGRLSMQYGVAALLSAVAVARSVIDHEERLKKLEAAVKVAV